MNCTHMLPGEPLFIVIGPRQIENLIDYHAELPFVALTICGTLHET